MSYIATTQNLKSYAMRTKRIATAEQVATYCTSARLAADKVIYDDKHDGMNGGMVRSLRIRCGANDLVIVVHKIS